MENEYPTAEYVRARIGRDVRVVYPNGGEVWGILTSFDGQTLHVDQIPQGSAPTARIPLDAVSVLWVRG